MLDLVTYALRFPLGDEGLAQYGYGLLDKAVVVRLDIPCLRVGLVKSDIGLRATRPRYLQIAECSTTMCSWDAISTISL